MLRRLIRFLEAGERVRIVGARGRAVKEVREGRKYVLEVRRGRGTGKLVGYVNNVKRGKPVAKDFTSSMIARVKHTKREKYRGQQLTGGGTFKIRASRGRVRAQIPERIIKKIKQNSGKTFGFRVDFKGHRLLTPFVYYDRSFREEDLRRMVVSNILLTINGTRHRISPLLEGMDEIARVRRIEEAQLTLQFMEVDIPTQKKCKKRSKSTKRRKRGKNR